MIELTGFSSALRGIGLFYWILAIGAISLALWKGRDCVQKVLWAAVVLAVFTFAPGRAVYEKAKSDVYAREAWAYFRNKCATKAGEKIFETYSGVKGVLVLKPLPPASEKDLYDRYWYGDPYSSATPTQDRGLSAARRLAMDWRHPSGQGRQRGLDFVEMKSIHGDGYIRIRRPADNNKRAAIEKIDSPISNFGISWEDISTAEDRRYWVAGSRLRVFRLKDMHLIAERIGYLIESGFGSTEGQRRPWLSARGFGPNERSCPYASDAMDQWFIKRVFVDK